MKLFRSAGLRGTVTVPGDKSVSHRALLLGALSEGTTHIHGFLSSADCLSTLRCFSQMGVSIRREGSEVTVEGVGLRGLKAPGKPLDAGNSGTTMRLLSGILAGQDFPVTIGGDASLSRRPMKRIMAPLAAMGCDITSQKGNDCAPLVIHGGKLHGISWKTPVASAQVKSAILLAGLYADGPTTVTEPALSRDHTERMLSACGVSVSQEGTSVTIQPAASLQPQDITVPRDISSAAYFLAAGLLVPGSDILIKNVGINPTRAGILQVAERMGADLTVESFTLAGGEPVADIRVRTSALHATEVGGAEIPTLIDELPVIALMAACAEGTTVIRDAAELRVKESDRIAVMAEGLSKLGARVTATEDGFIIEGGKPLKGAVVNSHGDHRAAMTFAVAGLVAGIRETQILDAQCVNISYPSFFDDLHALEVSKEQ